jgi:hypothetical protein
MTLQSQTNLYKTAKNFCASHDEQVTNRQEGCKILLNKVVHKAVSERSLQNLKNLEFEEQGMVQLLRHTEEYHISAMNSISARVQNCAENNCVNHCDQQSDLCTVFVELGEICATKGAQHNNPSMTRSCNHGCLFITSDQNIHIFQPSKQ